MNCSIERLTSGSTSSRNLPPLPLPPPAHTSARGRGVRNGLTLIELMVALALSGIVLGGIVSSFATAVTFEQRSREAQSAVDAKVHFEERLAGLLRGAFVSADENDTLTYFNGESTGTSTEADGSDLLTFTTLSEGLNASGLTSLDDFETLNQTVGPQGGIAEVSLSTTALGDTGQNRSGLFLREQRPADGDPTQGGYESVLDPAVQTIKFEFFNGTEWDPTWSTSGQAPQQGQQQGVAGDAGRRIPAAIRVTYTLNADNDSGQHVFVVRLPHSDVTVDNPVTAAGGAQ
jgi:prepilin-type N-terminal cleavage/methylation domain-containing protein